MAPIKSQKPKSGSSSASNKSTKPSKHSKAKTHTSVGTAKKDAHKKKRTYTEEELGIPKLNMITPVGVQKPKGKKKGKVFVDDQESMMTILAMVNAEKEGQIESKMMKARQMEEIREARKKEAEARQEVKRSKLVSAHSMALEQLASRVGS
ncbi:60S ribosomal subunit assembly/export protein loc1 [Macrophomina phaseolina]|uniref:60S ribosomal subunit assembly/export protein loc1 n=1 Tax=Macrophomina phaseolina TaxID=35725 RepID=A0ABQ8GKN9_9PEZI|nr:60S ribosomal subunit assembly/export protein loc1 [Macrophomina phaseolina]